ncbi:MAG: Tad domain-containing protein [Chloroflexi bacterium]|nr:Tad domain-containing protein [Chloroflexota bacterium]
MNKQTTHPQRQRGQSVVLIGLMMVGLVAFVGLALDAGQFYEMRRRMQNAADGGAYAGARELSNGNSQGTIYDQINQYTVGKNGVGNGADSATAIFLPSGSPVVSGGYGVYPLASDNCVQVSTRLTFQTLLISFLGFQTLDASGDAVACSGTLKSTKTDLWPVVVQQQNFQFGSEYCLWDQGEGCGNTGPGNFGWLDFNGGNNNSGDTANWLEDGYSGPYQTYTGNSCGTNNGMVSSIVAPICLQGDPGVATTNDIRDAAASKIGQDVTVLIYDLTYGSGSNLTYHVIAYARFTPTSINFKGNIKEIRGSFKKWTLPGEICTSGCGPDFGAKGVKLFKSTVALNTPAPTSTAAVPTSTPTRTAVPSATATATATATSTPTSTSTPVGATPTPAPPTATPSTTPLPTSTPCGGLVVPNFVGMVVIDARNLWTTVGFTGIFSPERGSNYKVVLSQSLTPGSCQPRTINIDTVVS